MTGQHPAPAQLDPLREFSTCVVASAIETFGVRLPNEGFADSGIRCVFSEMPPMLGYAATARIRSADPPMENRRYFYYDRPEWWDQILTIPAPRVVVIEDLDQPPGLGAFVGAVHANILLALGCIGLVTNGAVRDLPDIQPAQFQMFASNVAISHAYAHVFDFGGPVNVGGLTVKPGDLVHGDVHGVQTIPVEVLDKIPSVAREILKRRQSLIDLCRCREFSLQQLRQMVEEQKGEHRKP